MYSILILALYLLFYPKIAAAPDGGAARFFRRVLPWLLLPVLAYVLYQKWVYGEVRAFTQLNPLTGISLMQGYAALWLTHVATSVTWIFSGQNPAPWIVLPFQKGSSKLASLAWNLFLCVGLIPLLAIHMGAAILVAWAIRRWKRKRALQAAV